MSDIDIVLKLAKANTRIKELQNDLRVSESVNNGWVEYQNRAVADLNEANACIKKLEEELASEQAENTEAVRLVTVEHFECDKDNAARIKELEEALKKVAEIEHVSEDHTASLSSIGDVALCALAGETGE